MGESRRDRGLERASLWTPKRIVLAQAVGVGIVIFSLSGAFNGNPFVAALIALTELFGWGVCMLAWIKADSRERGYRLHRRFPLIIVLFGTFALIYYLLKPRGFAGDCSAPLISSYSRSLL
jgi:hypothetical protein